MTHHEETLLAETVPLSALQTLLRSPARGPLAGSPQELLLRLPLGEGGVLRVPLEERDRLLTTRQALRQAAASLRPQLEGRGLLASAVREEGQALALYFWFTADAPQGDDAPRPVSPGPSAEPRQPLSLGEPAPVDPNSEVAPPPVEAAPSQNDLIPVASDNQFTLSLAEAAQALGISTKTIRRAIKAGRAPARLVPGPRGPEYRVDIRPLLDPARALPLSRREEENRSIASDPEEMVDSKEGRTLRGLESQLARLEARLAELEGR